MIRIALVLILLAVRAFSYTADDTLKTISSDGSVGDFNAANTYVAGKAQDGWVHTVGAAGGSYTWATAASCDVAYVYTIQGATTSTRDTTTQGFVDIGCPTIASTLVAGQGISITCAPGKTVKLQNLIFREWTPSNCLILLAGEGLDCFRFTNIKWGSVANPHENASNVAYIAPASSGRTAAGPYGLIDHCQVLGSGYGFFVRENSAVDSWRRAMTFGTRSAVYIEDSTFGGTTYTSGRQSLDGNDGCRVVFRNNAVTDQTLTLHGPDNGGLIGSLQWEFMHNTITLGASASGLADNYIYIRSGTGVIFDNVFTAPPGGANRAIKVAHFPASSNSGVTVVEFYPGDYLGGQQPGSGVTVGATGQSPRAPAEPWVSMPAYFWGNTRVGSFSFGDGGALGGSPYSDAGFLVGGRDYYNDGTQKPGYTEYTYPHPLQNAAQLGGSGKVGRGVNSLGGRAP